MPGPFFNFSVESADFLPLFCMTVSSAELHRRKRFPSPGEAKFVFCLLSFESTKNSLSGGIPSSLVGGKWTKLLLAMTIPRCRVPLKYCIIGEVKALLLYNLSLGAHSSVPGMNVRVV